MGGLAGLNYLKAHPRTCSSLTLTLIHFHHSLPFFKLIAKSKKIPNQTYQGNARSMMLLFFFTIYSSPFQAEDTTDINQRAAG